MVEAVYKPRKPNASPLYQCVSEHFAKFESVYEERYQNKFSVLRDVVREVVDNYLGCGDLKKGFLLRTLKSKFLSVSVVNENESCVEIYHVGHRRDVYETLRSLLSQKEK